MTARVKETLSVTALAFSAVAGCILFTPLVGAQAGPIIPSTGILVNFQGVTLVNDPVALSPPDSNGAAGPNHFVEFVNGAFAIYNKNGSLGSLRSDTTFWSQAGINLSAGVSDPRTIYDPASQRWFAAQITTSNTGNNVLVARSDSSDPTGPWRAVNFTGNSGFADFPTLGVDANALYVGTNNFTSNGTFTGVSLFSIPKSDLTASTPTLTRMTSFENLNATTRGATLQPAVNLNGASGTILSTDATGSTFGTIYRATVTGSGGAGAHLSTTTPISVQSDGTPGLARQPDGSKSIDSGGAGGSGGPPPGNNFSASVYHVGDLLYAARTISDNHDPTLATHNSVDWSIVNAKTNMVVHEATISNPNFDYFYPSIAANANGNILLAFNRSGGLGSGAPGNISAFAEACQLQLTGSTVVCGVPFLLRAGAVDNYHPGGGNVERWGDYSTTTLDPNDPSAFWTVQEIPIDSNTWGTQITEIGFTGAVPEPSTLALMGLGLLGFAARWRRRASVPKPA